MKACEKR